MITAYGRDVLRFPPWCRLLLVSALLKRSLAHLDVAWIPGVDWASHHTPLHCSSWQRPGGNGPPRMAGHHGHGDSKRRGCRSNALPIFTTENDFFDAQAGDRPNWSVAVALAKPTQDRPRTSEDAASSTGSSSSSSRGRGSSNNNSRGGGGGGPAMVVNTMVAVWS
jgi:hypothetical protein